MNSSKITILLYLIFFVFNNAYSQKVFFEENFNSGIPDTWNHIITNKASGSFDTTSIGILFPLTTFDNTPFLHIWTNTTNLTNETLTSPVFSTAESSNLTITYGRHFTTVGSSLEGFLEVFDGSSWHVIEHFQPNTVEVYLNDESHDISAFANENMQIRLRFIKTTSFDIYKAAFALDNIIIKGETITYTEEVTNKPYTVYPNPFVNNIQLNNLHINQPLSILNAQGKILRSINVTASSMTLDCSSLPNGVYFISHNLETRKIIKH